MLRDCFGPCFRLMLRLPDSPPTGRTDVRREAERLLEEAGRLALRGREAATVETARRMVEAWMDETALGIAWEGRAAWLGNPLQRRWRTGRRGGDWFFDEIRRLSPHRAEDAELAEVALRCLGFGFRDIFITIPMGSASSTERLPSGSAVRRFRFLSHPLHICQGKTACSGMSGLC